MPDSGLEFQVKGLSYTLLARKRNLLALGERAGRKIDVRLPGKGNSTLWNLLALGVGAALFVELLGHARQ